MLKIDYEEVVKLPYSEGAIKRRDFPGFKEDYLVLHSLIKKYKPCRFMEIGTSTGLGTKVICKAMDLRRFRRNSGKVVYSLDVPPGTNPKILYPRGEDGHPRKAGSKCKFPYKQIFGNSYNFDFKLYYPIDGWFIDGKHNYKFAKNDTKLALRSKPVLIVWHDMQISGVNRAVREVMGRSKGYNLFGVKGTRMAFALKNSLSLD
jgi:hypothetical protein